MMPEKRAPIPQPTPAGGPPDPGEAPLAVVPGSSASEPSTLAATYVVGDGGPELALLYKRTYAFEHDRAPVPAEEQAPIDDEGSLHDKDESGLPPSPRTLPEVIGFKTGTDVVVLASAWSPKPVESMYVSVSLGNHVHRALVHGKRHVEYRGNLPVVSPAEPFEKIALRYENAYGGRDERYQQVLLEEVERQAGPDGLRRARPAGVSLLGGEHLLTYPRNRFGKGYILEGGRDRLEGREMPNIERPADLMTPERLVVGHPSDWMKQPLPIGFGCLDPLSFPRSAMMGFPPPTRQDFNEAREVKEGLIPRDFCRGNIFGVPAAEIPGLIHPAASRVASPGLWMPFLPPGQVLILEGMDPSTTRLCLRLPDELPTFRAGPMVKESEGLPGELTLATVDVESRTLSLIWVARTPLMGLPPPPAEVMRLMHIEMRRV